MIKKLKPIYKIQNIVATCSFNQKLNLKFLVKKLKNSEYKPTTFKGLIYKIDNPTATFLLFSNGEIVVTGLKTDQELKRAFEKLLNDILEAEKLKWKPITKEKEKKFIEIEKKVKKCFDCGIKLNKKNTGVLGYHPKKKNSEHGFCIKCIEELNKKSK